MIINTSYNVSNAKMPVNTTKAMEMICPDKVVLGEKGTDNTIAMMEQLKKMKAGVTLGSQFKTIGCAGLGGVAIGCGVSTILYGLGTITRGELIAMPLVAGALGLSVGSLFIMAKDTNL